MKNVNIALMQAFLALAVVIANASLHTVALIELNKANPSVKSDDNSYAQIGAAKRILLISILVQFISALVMILITFVIMYNKKKLEQHMNNLIYVALFMSGMLMLASGIVGAYVSTQLQCFKYISHVDRAWEYTTYSAVIGIVGVILILMVQAFIRRSSIKDRVLKYLGGAALPPPPAQYNVFTGKQKAAMRSGCVLNDKCIEKAWSSGKMPAYHPRMQRRMSDLSM